MSLFLSYRRGDAPGFAGRIYDRLADRFGDLHVFMDVDSIDIGVDFTEAIETAVASSDLLIAVIGPTWLTSRNEEGGRRLDDPLDPVRVEIETALTRRLRVVPLLVAGATLPSLSDLPEPLRPLLRRQALRIDQESFGSDVTLLIERLERALGTYGASVHTESQSGDTARRDVLSAERLVGPSLTDTSNWSATCVRRDAHNILLQVELTDSTQILEYRRPITPRPDRLLLNGEDVGRYGMSHFFKGLGQIVTGKDQTTAFKTKTETDETHLEFEFLLQEEQIVDRPRCACIKLDTPASIGLFCRSTATFCMMPSRASSTVPVSMQLARAVARRRCCRASPIAWKERPRGIVAGLLLSPRCDSELRVARHLSALPLIARSESAF